MAYSKPERFDGGERVPLRRKRKDHQIPCKVRSVKRKKEGESRSGSHTA